QATISPPRASSISRHSATKSAIKSSIGPKGPQLCNARALRGEELKLRYPCRSERQLGGRRLPRNGRADEEHRIGSIGNLDRPTRFGCEIVSKPCARRARLDA